MAVFVFVFVIVLFFFLVQKKILVIFAANEKNRGIFHSVILHDGSLGAAMAKDGDAWRF